MHAVILADFAEVTGGAQRVAIESALALAEAGLRVTYLHAIGEGGDARLDRPGIRRVGLGLPDIWDRPALEALSAGVWNREAARLLREALGDLPAGPTVLHLHQWTRGFSVAALPALAATGLPLAITLHDYFAACPNGVYYRFERAEPCALRPLSAACLAAACDPRSRAHKGVRVLRTALTHRLLARLDADLVHVSDRGLETIRPFLPEHLRHHRIDNPVAVAPGRPAALPAGGPIVYVGRLTPEKGADLVARAARRAGMPALIIGEGPLAGELAGPGVEVLGWRPPEEVDALLRGRARALAAPSRWYETGPLTVYEAQAAGLPVVVSDRAGAAERVRQDETGLVAAPKVDAFAEAFARLSDDTFARRLGDAAARAYWADPPGPAAHAARLVALYEGMLERAPAARRA